ncbi:MAG TPA: R3H domain-containing nucleic acid-binding protein [Patescibacteria group bacterium]|nr:R3H domain-containing nucleic acid-binding protein [Patescibacteria group bacterium]
MAQKTKDQKITEIKEIVKNLLNLLGVEAEVDVSSDKELYQIQLETNDPGILIGYHGETLRAIQRIVAMIIYRKREEWVKITVNVGDYRQRRQETLEKMAKIAAQKARFSKEAQSLPPMPASERRIIHLVLADEADIETVSEGEGRNRYVVVRPKL